MPDAVEIVIERWRSQERQCFYGISAAGGAIGYALVAKNDAASASDLRFLLAALILWALSMFAGLGLLAQLNLSQRMSLAAMRLKTPPDMQDIADRFFNNEDRQVGNKIHCFRNLQVALLVMGAFSYIPSTLDMLLVFNLSKAVS